ncbi:MAG: glycosyl transferase family 25 [Francisella sp.]|jgi:glycosyl transferase family 25
MTIKVYVVNLKKDKDRRDHICKHFAERNVEFEFIDAVYGKNLTPNELKQKVDFDGCKKNLGRETSLGEIGCSLSHKLIYDKIVEENLFGAFVFEDDAVLCKDISIVMKSIANNLNLFKKGLWLGLGNSYIRINKRILDINQNHSIHESTRTSTTLAYYIDYEGAKKLSKLNEKIRFTADYVKGYRNILNLYAADSLCAKQNPEINSTIGGGVRSKSNKPWIKKLVRTIRDMYFRNIGSKFMEKILGIKKSSIFLD